MLGGFAVDFYPRSPCGERLFEYIQAGTGILFLSTLSLRRATVNEDRYGQQYWNFYPRSPCGERLSFVLYDTTSLIFLSTLSLRRATIFALWMEASHLLFLSTLSLRRATCYSFRHSASCRHFYPRSPCGERLVLVSMICLLRDFYPRSPCGERQDTRLTVADVYKISIHALLAESDLLYHFCPVDHQHFYPRSPCGERPPRCRRHLKAPKFLSTLSLRRATMLSAIRTNCIMYFYPRSPCGERRSYYKALPEISIHALLAESDGIGLVFMWWGVRFLSTLSLRRATLTRY